MGIPILIRGDIMRSIDLTQGFYTIVDDEDYEWVSQLALMAHKGRTGGYYAVFREGRKIFRLHRAIMKRQGKRLGKRLVDHRNGDTLDNRRENLRVCNHAQNSANQKLRTDNKLGLKGVCQKGSKYQCYIQKDKRRKYLGTFNCPYEAARVYDSFAIEYFGEYARTNEALGLL